MIRILKVILVATTFAGATASAHAMPMAAPNGPTADIINAQYNSGGGAKYSNRHYSWCESRYKSYERSTNSYWNSYGERRQCRSPYM